MLIPSVHTRWNGFGQKIQEQIFGQYAGLSAADKARVEILMLTDTKAFSLGDKRNEMVGLAKGEYVVFVDDDDRLEPDYLSSLLTATDSGADVLTFHVQVRVDGGAPKVCRYSIKFAKDENTVNGYHRLPNHICAVKRRIALRTPYPSVFVGEDSAYAQDLRPLLKTEHAIDRVLYHYDYDHQTTETQLMQRMQGVIARRAKAPVVDVVMLSRASTPEMQAMTQHAIDTCRAGAGDNAVNVIVVEQEAGVRHKDAITLYRTEEFSYNAFANFGAKTGSAPWVMVANNDLEFESGWLDALLAAKHPCVSPVSPGESRQAGLARNELGETNGRHFAGWCFMLQRTLFDKIVGLDEDFVYWCADDSVIEQVKKAGVRPMVVAAAKVKHLISKTGGLQPPDSWTWAMVHKFEQKYGVKKFENDSRYAAWKRQNLAA